MSITTRRDLFKLGGGAAAALAGATAAPASAAPRRRGADLPVGYPLGPFVRDRANPILRPTNRPWESRFVFNPAAIVKDGRVHLLYRAQGQDGRSSIGLGISSDGVRFRRLEQPVMEASEPYELPGGCEDPRVVKVRRTYYMTYTGYDGVSARLCLATSRDLLTWTKHGPLFPDFETRTVGKPWSKSGAILTTPLDGRYYMYFGDVDIYYATSRDLIHWTPGPVDDPVMRPEPGTYTRASAGARPAAADHRERLHPADPQLGSARPRRHAGLPRRPGADRPGRADPGARAADGAVARPRDPGGDLRPGQQRRLRRGTRRVQGRMAHVLRPRRRGRRTAPRRLQHPLRIAATRSRAQGAVTPCLRRYSR